MPKATSECFPAHGNHHGKTAGVMIDFAYDLFSGTVLFHSLEGATTQDKTIGKEAIAVLKPGPSSYAIWDTSVSPGSLKLRASNPSGSPGYR